jgi:hypothetical protein
MKTLTKTMVAGSVIFATAMAMGQTTSNASILAARQAMREELAKTQVISSEGHNFTVKNPSPESIDKALKDVGGNATVDFMNGKKFKLQEAPGRVVIGSGADGLVANTNASVGTPMTVPVPLMPDMSITLVGASGTDGYTTCARYLTTDEMGNVKRNGSHDPDYEEENVCAKAGNPVRLYRAGLYFVTVVDNTGLRQTLLTNLGENEKIIIPLREIIVPAAPTKLSVKFRLFKDYEFSDLEKRKLAPDVFFDLPTDGCYSSIGTIEDLVKAMKSRVVKDSSGYNLQVSDGCGLNDDQTLFYSDFYSMVSNDGIHDHVFYVVPGVYGIAWLIDNQRVYTKGLSVQ